MAPASGSGRLRSDFHTLADEYARYRTSYSDGLFDAIAEYAARTRHVRALDLACGTGLATQGLVARGLAVTGVDVAPNMLRAAREAVPEATFFEGRAEDLPFGDRSFGLVVCGQAFHWFDGPKAYAEIGRVLVTGGTLASFWKNALDDDPFNKATDDLEREMSANASDHVQQRITADLRAQWNAARFGDRKRIARDVMLPFTVESYIGYQSSRETLRLSLGARRDEYLATLRRTLERLAPSGAFQVKAREYLYLGRTGAA